MDQVEILIFRNAEQDAKRSLTDLLETYPGHTGVQINELTWDVAWAETLKIPLYKVGANISQAGASWVYNFAAMNALRPLTKEVARAGGEAAFLPTAWESIYAADKREAWAAPWFVDVRVIYYWRDMLAKAGVDEATAFRTPEQMEETFLRLQASGISTPWVVPTGRELSQVASWIWGVGGDLASADGKQTLVNEPQTLAGIRAYFGLRSYLPREEGEITPARAFQLFGERRVAATIGPPWYYATMREHGLLPDVAARLGFAAPPGPTYVGGSNLVFWAHTRYVQAATDLIHFLITPEAQVKYCDRLGYLPARLEALKLPPFSTDPHYRTIVEVLHQGRTYPNFPRWALVEDQLGVAFGQIWADVLAHSGDSLDSLIARRLEPVSRRLQTILSS